MYSQYLIAGTALFTIASAVTTPIKDDWTLTLLKRQAPGTPAYACHEDCGNSITLSKGASPCTNADFLSNYQSCLECAGPDNLNIWRYYGTTLSIAGASCGLSTTPVSGGAVASTSSVEVPIQQTSTALSETTSSSVSSSTPAQTSASLQSSQTSSNLIASPTANVAGSALPTGSTTNSTTPATFISAANSSRGNYISGLGVIAIGLLFVF